MKQFDNVSGKYGAPMGRVEWHSNPEAKSVFLFKVKIDSQGYDDGGAYWGIGSPLYCATDQANYRKFTRAKSRVEAARILELKTELKVKA